MNSKLNFTSVCHKMWAVITTLLLFRSKSCIITQSNLTTKESFWLKNQFSSQHQNQEDYFLEFLHLSTIITRFILFEHTVRNLHYLSKNSTLISWENYRLFWVKNLWKCCGFGLFTLLAVDSFDFTRKIVKKKLGEKLVKMLWFWNF